MAATRAWNGLPSPIRVVCDVSLGTEYLSLPVEFPMTYHGWWQIMSGTVFSVPVAYLLTISNPATFVRDSVTVIIAFLIN